MALFFVMEVINGIPSRIGRMFEQPAKAIELAKRRPRAAKVVEYGGNEVWPKVRLPGVLGPLPAEPGPVSYALPHNAPPPRKPEPIRYAPAAPISSKQQSKAVLPYGVSVR